MLKDRTDADYVSFPFYFDSKPYVSPQAPKWGLTLLHANSMRFRWNETNQLRNETLRFIIEDIFPHNCSGSCIGENHKCNCKKQVSPLELIHSKTVYETKEAGDTERLQGDGLVTINKMLVPVVTVADCVPLFLFDTKTMAMGAFHSGWKGTGIIGCGIKKMQELYGSRPEDIAAAIGPHIGDCCYNIDSERADYFTRNFGPECVQLNPDLASKNEKLCYNLSLTKANLQVLKENGIKDSNIVVAEDCTCCTTFPSDKSKHVFGSFRRQAAFLPAELDSETRSKSMTVQAAFVIRP